MAGGVRGTTLNSDSKPSPSDRPLQINRCRSAGAFSMADLDRSPQIGAGAVLRHSYYGGSAGLFDIQHAHVEGVFIRCFLGLRSLSSMSAPGGGPAPSIFLYLSPMRLARFFTVPPPALRWRRLLSIF